MKVFILSVLFSVMLAGCGQQANLPANNAVPPVAAESSPATVPQADTAATAADSIYTELVPAKCKERKPKPDSGAIIEAECPGVGGYKVIFSASDHSQVLSMVDPTGKETLLSFRDALNTVADFMLGDKIEWRTDGKGKDAKPSGIIVRVTKFTDPEDKSKSQSILAVARLTGEAPCITDLVSPSADQNTRARQLADTKDRPCITAKIAR